MKKFAVCMCALAMVFCSMGVAGAVSYTFSDTIDYWNASGTVYGESKSLAHWWDSVYLSQGYPVSYQHDIRDDVDFARGDRVTEAYLSLDFTNDSGDAHYSGIILRYDYREFASYVIGEDGTVYNVGEVDDGTYAGRYLNIDWLNDDGLLDVTISVSNPLGTATAWLDESRVYGTASAVPEPCTVLLLGSGLAGLAGYRMRRRGRA